MSDQLHFLDGKNRIFEWWGLSAPGAPSAAGHVEPWCKSWVKGAQFVDIFLVGAGGAGGAGATKAVGVNGAGGSGGGAGGTARARFLLDTLPEVLYIYLPRGARGGTGNGDNAGIASIMLPSADFSAPTASHLLLASNSTASTGGGMAGGAAGAAGAGLTYASCLASVLSIHLGASAGHAGQTASTSAGSGSAGSLAVQGGAAGAGGNPGQQNGGGTSISGSIVPTRLGGLAGGGRGTDGLWVREYTYLPWTSLGGCGGGSTNTAGVSGGRGGDAAPGSGGGGGGAGIVAGGQGGNGGDSYMLLIAS